MKLMVYLCRVERVYGVCAHPNTTNTKQLYSRMEFLPATNESRVYDRDSRLSVEHDNVNQKR